MRPAAVVKERPHHTNDHPKQKLIELPRCPTGIEGLDEITGGGLPLGRPTLIAGSAGCGKTVFATEFLVRGATKYGEPGLFVAFEERAEDLAKNVLSMGFDLEDLTRRGLLTVDHVSVERSQIEETGEYDLEGLFIRMGHDIDRLGAKRVVLDTLESLFAGFENSAILRAELRRLFGWLKDKGVTAIITGERGDGTITRQRGIRLRLRDRARPSGGYPDLHAASPDRQVPRGRARNERIPVPDRRGRNHRHPDHRAPAQARRVGRTRLDRCLRPGHDAGRQGLLPGLERPRLGHGGKRQDHP